MSYILFLLFCSCLFHSHQIIFLCFFIYCQSRNLLSYVEPKTWLCKIQVTCMSGILAQLSYHDDQVFISRLTNFAQAFLFCLDNTLFDRWSWPFSLTVTSGSLSFLLPPQYMNCLCENQWLLNRIINIRNTWNHSTLGNLFVLRKAVIDYKWLLLLVIWNQIIASKLLMLDRKLETIYLCANKWLLSNKKSVIQRWNHTCRSRSRVHTNQVKCQCWVP